ncbi:MAG: hypothetical protein ABJP70_00105 [Erythrobacter sp.]
MLRIAILLAGSAALTGCGAGFEDKLAGTWDCGTEQEAPNSKFTVQLSYKASGEIDGTMVYEETQGEDTMSVRGGLDGTWDYDGETLTHKMTEEFEELKVNDEVIPREQVDPALIEGFRGEDSYENPVDLVESELLWYKDDTRGEVELRCKKAE